MRGLVRGHGVSGKEKKDKKVVLVIAGSDSSGGAGIQADIKALVSIGIHPATTITALTDQTTENVYDIKRPALEFIGNQIDHILSDMHPSAIKTGMLYDTSVIRLVGEKIRSGVPSVVDPVMVATVGKELFKPEYKGNIALKESLDVRYRPFVAALKKYILPYATLATPNISEASRLVGWEIKNIEDVKNACRTISNTGCRWTLIKGGHLGTDRVIDILFDSSKEKFYEFAAPRIKKRFHGLGCTYASLIAGFIAYGFDVPDAVRMARMRMKTVMYCGYSIGKLNLPDYGYEYHIPKDDAKRRMWLSVEEAAAEVERIIPLEFIPEVGINLGYSIPRPKSRKDVCALEGRIVRVGNRAGHLGGARFGASKHIAGIILAASAFNPQIRSAMNIRYNPGIVKRCAGAFTISSFDRSMEPEGVSTMSWGTREAIKKIGKVPDIIWDNGGVGKEAMIRLLGKNPDEVVEKLRKIVELTQV